MTDSPKRPRRTWLWVLLGTGIVLFFVAIGAVIATTAWVRQNLELSESTAAHADAEFAQVRARFAGRPPLLELRDGRPVYAAGKPPAREGAPASSLDRLHVLVWAPDDQRLVSVAVPFWFLRLKSGPIEFGAYASGVDDRGVELSPQDLERHGAGIILDATSPEGERVLLWAQ